MENINHIKELIKAASNVQKSAISEVMLLTAQRAADKGDLRAAETFLRLAVAK